MDCPNAREEEEESEFLKQLKAEVLGLLGEEQSVAGASLVRVPLGGLPFTPILESLLDALGIKGTSPRMNHSLNLATICLGSSVPASPSPLPRWKSSRQDL